MWSSVSFVTRSSIHTPVTLFVHCLPQSQWELFQKLSPSKLGILQFKLIKVILMLISLFLVIVLFYLLVYGVDWFLPEHKVLRLPHIVEYSYSVPRRHFECSEDIYRFQLRIQLILRFVNNSENFVDLVLSGLVVLPDLLHHVGVPVILVVHYFALFGSLILLSLVVFLVRWDLSYFGFDLLLVSALLF